MAHLVFAQHTNQRFKKPKEPFFPTLISSETELLYRIFSIFAEQKSNKNIILSRF